MKNLARLSLADALFSATQQRVLGRLFGQPDRSFYASELIAAAGGGSGGVQRELAKLEAAGLVETARIGNQKHYKANRSAIIFQELAGIFRKTSGMADVLLEALNPLTGKIDTAFVFGSVAQGTEGPTSDIDLMVVGPVTFASVVAAVHRARERVGREVNPVVMSLKQFRTKLKNKDRFVSRIVSEPKIILIGDPGESAKPA